MRSVACSCVIGAAVLLNLMTSAQAQRSRLPHARPPQAAQNTAPPAAAPSTVATVAALPPNAILSSIAFADIGFNNGFRFANLAGRREIFVPLPQGVDIVASELVLVMDDVSAHESRRSLEILVNDRSLTSIALDGRGGARTMRIPLANAQPRDGFLKLSFLYSGAATQDRCIDVRYVGDSLMVRAESALSIAVVFGANPDVATTVALMPQDLAIVLPRRRLSATDAASALTVARAFAASGRKIAFHRGFDAMPELLKRTDERAWTRGIVMVGSLDEVAPYLDSPIATLAGPSPSFGAILALRVGGLPALLVSDPSAVRAGGLIGQRLTGQPLIGATRGVTAASVGTASGSVALAGKLNFDQLGLSPAQVEVFGRADLPVAIDTRLLPANTRPSRVMMDVMVAPDGTGEKAVVSSFVNDRLLASGVAATGEPTKLDLALPDGLVGTVADVLTVVQRRSAQGDCRFEPQGYPAQILGSSTVVLDAAPVRASDFSDLIPRWANGIEVMLPLAAADEPLPALPLAAAALTALSPDSAPISVSFVPPSTAPMPSGPYLALTDVAPGQVSPRVRFDRGRIAVTDRGGKVRLDLGGFTGGAVAQIVNVGDHSGLWIKGLVGNALPAPAALKLDRGDVAFIDRTGVALALSTERDTLVRVSYPDQVSWITIADRFRFWIIGLVWLLATGAMLFGLQRMLRRRRPAAGE